MARYRPNRKIRYGELRAAGFQFFEASRLSELQGTSRGLLNMIADRRERRADFEKLAANKIEKGEWRRRDVAAKWIKNLRALYTKMGWMIHEKGHRNEPSPWAMYRFYERHAGGPEKKGYTSPWELRVMPHSMPRLQRGIILAQRLERQAARGRPVSESQIRYWINQKNVAIAEVKTGKRREELVIERNRLERLLTRRNN